mgnify:CR=1 FL=1|jgi:hypothetical protein
MEQPILTKLLLTPNNMKQKAVVRGFAILAVVGLTLGALLPAFAGL